VRIIERTWTAIDICGNQTSCVQIISVADMTPPEISCPATLTIECGVPEGPEANGFAIATDNCDPNPLIDYSDNVITTGTCPVVRIIERTWTAIDICGNQTSCVQTISINDLTPPLLECPPSVTVELGGEPERPDEIDLETPFIDCDPNPVIDFSDNVIITGTCPVVRIIERTWTILDACGNQSICIQYINLSDQSPPILTLPPDVIISCEDDSSPAFTGNATSVDSFDPDPVIDHIDTESGNCPVIIERTWTAVDLCGNAISDIQVITINDDIPPVLVNVPGNIEECEGDQVSFSLPSATDNCDENPTVSCVRSDNLELNEVYPVGVTTVTCTASDICGNSTSATFTVTVFDGVSVDLGTSCTAVYPAYADSSCVTLTPTVSGGTPPYTYAWTNNIDASFMETTLSVLVCPLVNTTYSVLVTDSKGCTSHDKVEVQSFDISCKAGKVIICHIDNGKSLCVGVAATSGHLSHGDHLGPCGLIPCAEEYASSYATLGNSGDATISSVNVADFLKLYPNPATDEIILEFQALDSEELNLVVYNANGTVVIFEAYNEVEGLDRIYLGIAELSEGMYFVQMHSGDVQYHAKFVKNSR
jgi:hypothetical protein